MTDEELASAVANANQHRRSAASVCEQIINNHASKEVEAAALSTERHRLRDLVEGMDGLEDALQGQDPQRMLKPQLVQLLSQNHAVVGDIKAKLGYSDSDTSSVSECASDGDDSAS